MIEQRKGEIVVHLCMPKFTLDAVVEHIGDSPFEFTHYRNAVGLTVKPGKAANHVEEYANLCNADAILHEKVIGSRYMMYLYELNNIKYNMLDIIIPDLLRLSSNEFVFNFVKGQYVYSPIAKAMHVMNNRHHHQYWSNHVLTSNPNELFLLSMEVAASLYVHKYSDYTKEVDFIKTPLVQMLPDKLRELVIPMIEQLDNAQEFR